MKNYKKINEFTSIAMKCNKEQFEEIKPILEKYKLIFSEALYAFFDDNHSMLTNFYNKKPIISSTLCREEHLRTYHNEWNAETFLKACGIVKENPNIDLSKLTPELITELCKDENVKEFMINNGVVKNELEDNTYYQFENGALQFNIKDGNGYGICVYKKLQNECEWLLHSNNGKFRKATPQEIETALKNEAVKRGYKKNGVNVKSLSTGVVWTKSGNITFEYSERGNSLKMWSDLSETKHDGYKDKSKCYIEIFKYGTWAEIIPQPKLAINPLDFKDLNDAERLDLIKAILENY